MERANGHQSPEYQRGVEVGEALLGSAGNVDDHLDEGEEALKDHKDFCAGLDDTTLECTGCGWWVEPHEITENGCDECAPEDDDED